MEGLWVLGPSGALYRGLGTANAFNKKSFQTRNQGLVRLKFLSSASRCHTVS